MEVRKENTVDFYPTISDWWNNHQIKYEGKTISYPIIPLGVLPQNVFIVRDNGEDLYCVFFYHTDSGLCWSAYPTRSPKVKPNKEALNFLMIELEKYARSEGYFLIFTTSPIPNIQKSLLEVGFVEGDMRVNQYYKQLPPEN